MAYIEPTKFLVLRNPEKDERGISAVGGLFVLVIEVVDDQQSPGSSLVTETTFYNLPSGPSHPSKHAPIG